jgi:hypothetical protein
MKKPAAKPRTVVGQWMLAGLLDHREEGTRRGKLLNGGVNGWNYDEPAVVEIICEIEARRYFSGHTDIRAITAFVAELRAEIHSVTPPGHLEMEALVRLALGDPDVDIHGIKHLDIFVTQGVVAGKLSRKLGLSEAEIVQLIVQAEQLAFERGWHPPLCP